MKKTLVNISNHPSKNWSDEQKSGWDVIVDIPFPNIPASATTAEVADICAELLEKWFSRTDSVEMMLTLDATAVFVAGEFTATSILQNFLSFKGLKMLSACTERQVVEKDGVKTSIFSFAQWREIPSFHSTAERFGYGNAAAGRAE